MRDAGQEHPIEVGEHVGKRLRLLGRSRRQLRTNLAGLDCRHHGQLAHAVEVVRGPVDRGVAVGTELLGVAHAGEATVRLRP